MRLRVAQFFIHAGQMPFFSGKSRSQRSQRGPVQVPIDGKRLALTQLLQAPRHLGHLFGLRASVAQRQGRRIHSLNLQLTAADNRVSTHLGQRGDGNIDYLALSRYDEDAMLGSHQPLAAKAPVRGQIRRGADEHLLLSGAGRRQSAQSRSRRLILAVFAHSCLT